ncbi:hypothetical protein [Paractinoplanes durhamensis]|uniref:Lipoprotein n=1 Tax=Paractinoplanes durhamensis TaxID=113563 RepID=A0ABQ3YV48_9ACTN|nr:hypothetical protein [Actinoplanes durhamensis]GIE01405.1 hypothetical protein Adu01nite_27550 [Actinoplanes durhamensis]
MLDHLRRRAPAFALAVVALAAIAACSDDKPDTAASPADTQTTAAGTTTGPATETAATEQAADPSLVGTQYGYITAVDASARTLTFDKVDWFTGAAATAACKEDGEAITDAEKCNDYYIRNNNPLLRTAPIGAAAKLSLVSPNDALAQLEVPLDKLSAEREHRLFILTFDGGSVTSVKEQYLP